MSTSCFAVFIGCFTLCYSAYNAQLDPNTLREVFGFPPPAADAPTPAESHMVQASAVTPEPETVYIVDNDYWDAFDEYNKNASEYDIFDWTITKRVATSTTENFLVSPLSLKLALAILTEAATGVTQSELSSVLGFDLDRDVVRRKFSTIIESLQKESPQYILKLGSRIYVTDTAQTRQMFAAIAQQFYKTELKTIDFHNPPAAVQEINTWVSNVTEGRIANLVDEDDVSGLVVLLISTLYFKGTWRHQFAPNATKDEGFYVTPEQQKKVPMMHINEDFHYFESNKFDAKIVRLPYHGIVSMYIVVPNALTGLSRVVNNLVDVRQELKYLRSHTVDVSLPKFKFDYTSKLDEILKQMGVRTAFTDAASFPGIARGQKAPDQLKVSSIIQKSGIEVNELGSVAFSATQISLVNKFGSDSEAPVEVIANRPFLFFIQDDIRKQLLFTGQVVDPSLNDGKLKLVV